MVCYILPTIGAILVHAKRKVGRKDDEPGLWLSHLLAGGAIFGIVDHWWNGQLTLIGPNPVNDILLGAAITVAIFAYWYATVLASAAAKAGTARIAK